MSANVDRTISEFFYVARLSKVKNIFLKSIQKAAIWNDCRGASGF